MHSNGTLLLPLTLDARCGLALTYDKSYLHLLNELKK